MGNGTTILLAQLETLARRQDFHPHPSPLPSRKRGFVAFVGDGRLVYHWLLGTRWVGFYPEVDAVADVFDGAIAGGEEDVGLTD